MKEPVRPAAQAGVKPRAWRSMSMAQTAPEAVRGPAHVEVDQVMQVANYLSSRIAKGLHHPDRAILPICCMSMGTISPPVVLSCERQKAKKMTPCA